MEDKSEQLKMFDEMHSKNQFKELFEQLPKALENDPNNVELLWRSARSCYDAAAERPKENDFRKQVLTKGLEYAKKSLELDSNSYMTHKWFAIMISSIGEFASNKERIADAYKIKEHAMKAIEIKPDDASTLHLLGRWCFRIASISWIERTAASALFGTPPTSSFDESLQYLLKAYAVNPNFLSNTAWIGDLYVALKKNDSAKEYYNKVLNAKIETEADKFVYEDVKKKMSKL